MWQYVANCGKYESRWQNMRDMIIIYRILWSPKFPLAQAANIAISVLPLNKYSSRQRVQRWRWMLDAIVICIAFYSDLRRERRDHDRFPWPRKDSGFGARGILLNKYIFRQTCKIWIAADNTSMPKDARNNRHLTHFKRELDRRNAFTDIQTFFPPVLGFGTFANY